MASTTILGGRWTVYDLDENRRKAAWYNGTGGGTRDTTKSLYLALADLEHSGTWMDDGSAMQADTPVEFKVGQFDAGDDDPFFIDPESVQFLYGGSLKSVGWKRTLPGDGTGNIGIMRFDYSVGAGTDFVAGDIGKTISSALNGCSGTLLFYISDGANGTAWVRPDSNTAADDWDDAPAATDITTTGGTGTGLNQTAAATTGEMNWANLYNDVGGVASLQPDTHLHIYQGAQSGDTAPDAVKLEYDTGVTTQEDYWDDGTFDIMLLIADQSSDLDTQSTYLDEGFATIFARQYQKTYSFNIASLYPGGRNPIGMETLNDALNNPSGYGSVTLGTSANNWNVGDEVLGATSGARAIITATSGSNPTITLEFYYIGKSIEGATTGYIEFNGSEAINNVDDTGTSASSGAVSNVGPAALAGLTVTHGADGTYDVDQNGTNELYSIVWNVNSELVGDAFEWAKYTYRMGNRVTTHGDGTEAEQYIGSDYRVVYTGTVTGAVNEGDVVTGVTSGATGTVVAHHTTDKYVILRNTRGTFQDAEQIQVDGGNYIPASGTTVAAISPVKACPLGTFAGGILFLAPGIVLQNRNSADANNYRTIDDIGNENIQEPVQISITASNTRIKDWITFHRLTASGGTVEKDRYTVTSGGLLKGGNTVVINEAAIDVDVPGKSSGGVVVLRDVGTFESHVYHFSSWTGQTFTLDQTVTGTATAGGDTTTLTAASGLSALRVGELVRDTTNDEWAYVTEVTSDTSVKTTAKATSWASVAYTANDLVQAYDSADKIYVPLIYTYETAGTDASPGSESVSIVFDTTFYGLLKARAANDSTYKIKPFTIELTIDGSNIAQSVIRNAETITT